MHRRRDHLGRFLPNFTQEDPFPEEEEREEQELREEREEEEELFEDMFT